MAKSRVVSVTPNVLRCVKELKAVLKNLPPGEFQTKAKEALDYLERTFAGDPQPNRGRGCQFPNVFIR